MALVAIEREAGLTWGFVRYDLSSTVVPATLGMVAAARVEGGVRPGTLVLGALYFLLYVYAFAVSNQIIGVEEDRRNKPDRPLPAGLVALRGAWARWLLAMVLFPLLGAALGVGLWAVLWQVCFCLYNFGGFARHWATKSLIMGVGLVTQLAAAWGIVGPVPGIAWQWISGLAVVAFVAIRFLMRRFMPQPATSMARSGAPAGQVAWPAPASSTPAGSAGPAPALPSEPVEPSQVTNDAPAKAAAAPAS